MTPREQIAFAAGIEAARQMALTAAVSIEIRDDAREVRQQAAVAALQGLAIGLKDTFLSTSAPPVVEVETCFEPELNRRDENDAR